MATSRFIETNWVQILCGGVKSGDCAGFEELTAGA
jgi:hypothetical protein